MTDTAPRIAATLLCALALATPLSAQDYPELTRNEELRLAMSAGPLDVSVDADVYVMAEDGFERAIEDDNRFACLVVRSAADRTLLAPHCLNPAAVETVLPATLREGELQSRG